MDASRNPLEALALLECTKRSLRTTSIGYTRSVSNRAERPWNLLAVDDAALQHATLVAQHAGLPIRPLASAPSPAAILSRRADTAEPHPILSVHLPDVAPLEWVEWAGLARQTSTPWVAAVLGPSREAILLRGLLWDLGVPAVSSPEAAVAAAALLQAGVEAPWNASARRLPESEQLWLPTPTGKRRARGHWVRLADGRLSLSAGVGRRPLGRAEHLGEALRALRAAQGASWPAMPAVEGVEEEAVRQVLFGPPRTLSDPASKSALAPYGVPLPTERLCRSASRTAAEAMRLRFPVRIALASPDLRTWEHPELVADGVDNASRAKDVFRQFTAWVRTHAPEARVLGVTVSVTTAAYCHLRIQMRPAPHGRVLLRLGFADPHGLASEDEILTILPIRLRRLEQAARRLRGHELLFPESTRREVLEHLGEVLLRLTVFLHRWRREVDALHIEPLAVLVGGQVEVREAAVTVGDAFERDLYGTPSSERP